METTKPGGRPPGRKPARRLATWAAASVLAGGGLAGVGLLAAGPALADTGPGCPAAVVSGTTATVTCGYTGGSQYWTVPAGVTQATFAVYGAEGQQAPDGAAGGLGAEVAGTLTVTPGAALQVNAGQAGSAGSGFGGGGAPGNGGGGGGGESDVRAPAAGGSYPITAALLVAGGGGGGGTWGTSGTNEGESSGGEADEPGRAAAPAIGDCGEVLEGGNGGVLGSVTEGGGSAVPGGAFENDSSIGSTCGDVDGTGSAAGGLGSGGSGAGDPGGGGGGGGGGYYGGSGGSTGAYAEVDGAVAVAAGAGGGGGGASYAGSTSATVTDGVAAPDDAPDGEVVITYQVPQQQAPAFTADTPPASGGAGTVYSYQFAASGSPAPSFSLAAGAPSWLSVGSSTGVVTGTPPAGTKSFSYSVTAANAAGSVTAGPFTVAVSAKADVTAGLSCTAALAVGQAGTCTLTVANSGPALATTTVAAATVPAKLKVTACSGDCSRLGGLLGWSLGSLPAGQSESLTISVTAASAGTAVVAAADGALTPDPNLLNNVADATVKITG